MAATAPLYTRPKSSERALHQSKLLAAAYALKLALTRYTYAEKPEGWSRELPVGRSLPGSGNVNERWFWFWPTFRDQTDPGSVAEQATMPGM